MFTGKYTKPLTLKQLSKLHGEDVRVHFLNDDTEEGDYIGDEIWRVKVDDDDIIITSPIGEFRTFDDYKNHYKDYTLSSGVLVYRLPQIPCDIEW